MSDDNAAQDGQQPVAYDAEGRPLYAAPVESAHTQVTDSGKQVVHVARSTEPIPEHISEETRRKHQESVERFPWLNLSQHEYVISAVTRHSIGLWTPILLSLTGITLTAIFMFCYPDMARRIGLPLAAYSQVIIIATMVMALFAIGGYVAVWVYTQNRFFLTNESVIQEIQMSLFSKREQTVSLANIEDASYSQQGPLQTIFNYGSIRLSTEGDETTYRFHYVANPKREIAILNNAVEAFKNGRPVGEVDD